MTKLIRLALALCLVMGPLPAYAARPTSEGALLLQLNGVPVRLGVITTAGASTTNATTASPFTVTGGTVIRVTCDAAAVFTIGSSASTSYTNAAFGDVMATGTPRYFVLRETDTTIAVAAAAAVNCAVHVMR